MAQQPLVGQGFLTVRLHYHI